jgi:ferredoxin
MTDELRMRAITSLEIGVQAPERSAVADTGRGGRMKVISLEEALAISDQCEEAGLIHNTPGNSASLSGVICNCCNDCCSTFEPAIQSGRLNEVAAPSRFRAAVKEDLCRGCQQCVVRCPFDAIEMVKVAGSKKMKARVTNEKCLGCGVCVVGCKQAAMTFELIRPPEFIPPKREMWPNPILNTL